jgi:hypothetical protein
MVVAHRSSLIARRSLLVESLTLAAGALFALQATPAALGQSDNLCGGTGDVVFFLDTSGSMRCTYQPVPAIGEPEIIREAQCESMTAIIDNIEDAFLLLNPNITGTNPSYNFVFTVYVTDWDPDFDLMQDRCLFQLDLLDTLYGDAFEVGDIRELIYNKPAPFCLSDPPQGSGCEPVLIPYPQDTGPLPNRNRFEDTPSEDWARALAHVSVFHPWRQPTCDTFKRYYIPMSDEGPLCGSRPSTGPSNPLPGCDMRVDADPDTFGDQPGPDRQAIVEAAACALRAGVRAFPIVTACIDASTGTVPLFGEIIDVPPLAGPGACDPLVEICPRQPDPLRFCTCAGAGDVDPNDPLRRIRANTADDQCVVAAAELMAELTNIADPTSAFAKWLVIGDWRSFAIHQFIASRVDITVCADIDCDTIDFNNDGLFPADEDLIAFLAALAGAPCPPELGCGDIDFDGNCLYPDDGDLVAFLIVLAGGECQ